MYTAEQWLADLEAKAVEASPAEKQGLVCGWWDIAEFREAATPEAVLRLVGMVRWLALNCTCPPRVTSLACTKPSCTACRLAGAYAATEERHG